MAGNNTNQIPLAPPLPPVILAVNIDQKIVQEMLDACRSGQADKVCCFNTCLHIRNFLLNFQ